MIPLIRPSIRRRDMEAVLDAMLDDSAQTSDALRDELTHAVAEHIAARGGVALREPYRAVELLAQLVGQGARVALSPLAPLCWEAIQGSQLEPCWIDTSASDRRAADGQMADGRAADTGGTNAHTVADWAAMVHAAPCGAGHSDDTHTGSGGAAEAPLLIEDLSSVAEMRPSDRRRCGYALVGLETHHTITGGGGALVLAFGRRRLQRLQEAARSLPDEAYLPQINAALALAQLRQLGQMQERRSDIDTEFRRAAAAGRCQTLLCAIGRLPGFPLMVDNPAEVIEYAAAKGVACAPAFGNTILGRSRIGGEGRHSGDYRHAARLLAQCVLFPLYPLLSGEERDLICRVLRTL